MAKNVDKKKIEQGIFHSRDGTSLYYERRGKGRPLIFCSGLLCRREHWRPQLKHFSERYDVISLDYRGHQRSGLPKNEKNITLGWCANDVQDLIQHLSLKEAVCFGHSMGVSVTSIVATLEPEVVKGLVLVCGSVTNPFKIMFYSDFMDKIYRWVDQLYDWSPEMVGTFWRKFTEPSRLNYLMTSRLGFNPSLSQREDIEQYIEGVNAAPLSTFFQLLKDYATFPGFEVLKKVNCPTLVVAGGDDCITPMSHQEAIAKALKLGELEDFPSGSHNTHLDLPYQVNARIEKFLERMNYR